MNLTTLLPKIREHRGLSLVFSLLLIAGAVILRKTTPITLSYVTFYPAVILATVAGGWILGLAAMLLATLSAIYFFVQPTGSFSLGVSDMWNAAAFWVVCLLSISLTNLLIDLLMNTHRKAEKYEVLYERLAFAEQQQHTLMRELSHRMKNQYAVILAMARAAGSNSSSVAEFQAAFSDRLQSMSRAHDLLTRTNWQAVSLLDLITTELEPFAQEGRLVIQGEEVLLKDQGVVNIGMALHELATNSSKHGAWSGTDGTVRVSWSIHGDHLRFQWQEIGGPGVQPSERRGFGRKMLETIVPSALQGTASLELAPEGLCWTLEVPPACLERIPMRT